MQRLLPREPHKSKRAPPTAASSPRCCFRAMIPREIAVAAAQGNKDAVVAWLDTHPERVNDLGDDGMSLLLCCLEHDWRLQAAHLELIRHLLSRGADPNHTCFINQRNDETQGCMTPLFSICVSDSPHAPGIVACLLSAGADPNLRIADHLDQNGEPSSTFEEDSTPIIGAVRFFLGTSDGSYHQRLIQNTGRSRRRFGSSS